MVLLVIRNFVFKLNLYLIIKLLSLTHSLTQTQTQTHNCPQLWNKLPITVTNENNTNTFKSKLHKYLLGLD